MSPRIALIVLLAVGGSDALDGSKTRPTGEHAVKLNGQTFTLPEGFTIELVAGSPLVERPITADFDEVGRLYVSESSGSNEPVAAQNLQKPHRILRLEDTKGAGVFDRRTVFADRMMLPEGTMWCQGSLYVAAPPSIWKLTDTKGAGVADEWVEWFQGKTLTNCANDLHGPYLGPDGWIYWGKGAFASQTYNRPGEAALVTKAAHVFRCRPDGTGLEPVLTGGMDNPIDVAFTPGGEPIVSSTFVQYPAGGKRDGLLHAIHGALYGKEHLEVLKTHVWTHPQVMPAMTHLGPAAVSGLTRYESRAFGPDYQDNLFAANFNLRKVTRHALVPDGATFRTVDSDFVVSDHKEFHPTDVLEDADGSLLIIDTGGWYKLCCPTSQLVRPDVLGGIYRVRKVDAPKIVDPRGRTLEWAKATPRQLAERLDDPRPAVRRRAKETLAERGKEALPALGDVVRKGRSNLAKLEAVWTLVRIDDPLARELNRSALKSNDETIRQAALQCVSRWKDEAALPQLRDLLKSHSPHNARAAAEAVGRIFRATPKEREARRPAVRIQLAPNAYDQLGAAAFAHDRVKLRPALEALMPAFDMPTDRALHHSLTYALVELGDPFKAYCLNPTSPSVRRAVVMAMEADADPSFRPSAEFVLPLLDSPDTDLRSTANWLIARHPDWGKALKELFAKRMHAPTLTEAERQELIRQLASMASSVDVQSLLTEQTKATAPTPRRIALAAMEKAQLKDAPPAWCLAIIEPLRNPETQADAVAAARAFRLKPRTAPPLIAALASVANDAKRPASIRLGALAALPVGAIEPSAELFSFLRASMRSQQPLEERSLAIDVLGRSKLSDNQLVALAELTPDSHPLELDRLLDLFTGCNSDVVGERLLAALESPKLKSMLRSGNVRRVLKGFGAPVQARAEALYSALDAETADQRRRLEELLVDLPKGDVRRGQEVFNRPKIACVSCHAIGYVGGKIGPDLTRIGSVRTNRDLLESIVFPSASFVRGYEPWQIVTTDGKSHNGLLQANSPDEVTLTTGPNLEVRIARRDIDEITPSRVSLMPAGFEQQLTRQELADLVAFLLGCK